MKPIKSTMTITFNCPDCEEQLTKTDFVLTREQIIELDMSLKTEFSYHIFCDCGAKYWIGGQVLVTKEREG